MDFKSKYIKYKNKYLKLKGGGELENKHIKLKDSIRHIYSDVDERGIEQLMNFIEVSSKVILKYSPDDTLKNLYDTEIPTGLLYKKLITHKNDLSIIFQEELLEKIEEYINSNVKNEDFIIFINKLNSYFFNEPLFEFDKDKQPIITETFKKNLKKIIHTFFDR